MSPLEQQIRFARRRIDWQLFLNRLPWFLCLGWFVALIAVALPKVIAFPSSSPTNNTNLWNLGWFVGSTLAAFAIPMAWALIQRTTDFRAATEIDRRAGLKERAATAFSLDEATRETPAGQIVVNDANHSLKDLDLTDAFQVRVAKFAPLALLVLVAAAAIGWLAPNRIEIASEDVDLTQVVNPDVLKETTEELKEKLREQLEFAEANDLEEAADLFKALERRATDLENNPSMSKKDALLKLNDLKDQLEERARELGDTKEMRDAFSKLEDIKDGPAEKAVEAMKDGEFGEAAEQLSDLAKQLGNDELSDAQKQELKEQIEQLANELSELAEAQEREKQAIEQQIADAQKSGDIEKAAELQEQLDQLNEQQGGTTDQLQELAESLKNAANGLEPGEAGENSNGAAQQQAQDALQQLADQMQGMEQQLNELESLEGVLSQVSDMKGELSGTQPGEQSGAESQPGMGGQPGEASQPGASALAQGGSGQGQEGQGLGEGQGSGKRPIRENETGTFDSQVDGNPSDGEVIVSGEVGGPNRIGQSKVEVQAAIRSRLDAQIDPVGEQQLPRSKRNHVKDYFDKLRKKGD